jgi:hypothetical protein
MNEKRLPGSTGISPRRLRFAGTGDSAHGSRGVPSFAKRAPLAVQRVPGMSATQGECAIVKALHDAIALLEKRRGDLARWDPDTQENFSAWFGTDSIKAREVIDGRIGRALKTLRHLSVQDFIPIPKPKKRGKKPSTYEAQLADWQSTYAYVCPGYTRRRLKAATVEIAVVYVGPEFASANDTTRAGTIIHEVSHFFSVGHTKDVSATFLGDPRKPDEREMYGYNKAERLSLQSPEGALNNADNFEFFIESHDPADHPLDLDGAGDFEVPPKRG